MEHDNLSGGFCSGLTSTADHNRISERTYHDQGCGRNHSKNSVGFQRITLATVIFYILLLGRQSSALATEGTANGCYPCNQINRRWGVKFCENHIDDCGDCLPGYKFQDDKTCKLPSVEMSQSGHPVQRPDGSDVTLKCSYDSLENCELIRNGVVTDVSERFHQYLQPDNRQAKKCSVLIDNLQEVDDADSSCQIRADFKHNNAVKGKDSLLNVNDPTVVSVRDGEFARVPTGESVMLICHLEKKTDCLWTKNDVKQEISSRYSYYDPKDGVQTRDCSLKISAFQADDEGKWQCLNAGTQELVTTLYLNQIYRLLNVLEQPEDQVVTLGSKAILKCRFNFNTTCTWKMNENEITIEDRYQYLNRKSGKYTDDCTIQILGVRPEDLGKWQCSQAAKHRSEELSAKSAWLMVQPDAQLSLFEDESERMAQSSDDTEITLVCSARRGYPEAKVHWEVNGKRLEDFYRTVEDHGLFTAISALHLPLTELDHVKCIVDHPAFPTPKMYVASDAQFLGNDDVDISDVPVVEIVAKSSTTPVVTLVLFAATSIILAIALVYKWYKGRDVRSISYSELHPATGR